MSEPEMTNTERMLFERAIEDIPEPAHSEIMDGMTNPSSPHREQFEGVLHRVREFMAHRSEANKTYPLYDAVRTAILAHDQVSAEMQARAIDFADTCISQLGALMQMFSISGDPAFMPTPTVAVLRVDDDERGLEAVAIGAVDQHVIDVAENRATGSTGAVAAGIAAQTAALWGADACYMAADAWFGFADTMEGAIRKSQSMSDDGDLAADSQGLVMVARSKYGWGICAAAPYSIGDDGSIEFVEDGIMGVFIGSDDEPARMVGGPVLASMARFFPTAREPDPGLAAMSFRLLSDNDALIVDPVADMLSDLRAKDMMRAHENDTDAVGSQLLAEVREWFGGGPG